MKWTELAVCILTRGTFLLLFISLVEVDGAVCILTRGTFLLLFISLVEVDGARCLYPDERYISFVVYFAC